MTGATPEPPGDWAILTDPAIPEPAGPPLWPVLVALAVAVPWWIGAAEIALFAWRLLP